MLGTAKATVNSVVIDNAPKHFQTSFSQANFHNILTVFIFLLLLCVCVCVCVRVRECVYVSACTIRRLET